jgi:hypothetical protein
MTEEIDFNSFKMFALYGQGWPVTDIAVEMGVCPKTVYAHLQAFPAEYAAAKRQLAEHRLAKYRRAGSLAIDLQLKYLEEFPKDNPDTLHKEISKIATIGEAVERRADLMEGKPTDRVDNLRPQIVMFNGAAVPDSTPEAGQ